MPVCEYCKKNKIVLIKCMCGKEFCIKHNLPNKHKCTHESDSLKDTMSKEATGAFLKIQKI